MQHELVGRKVALTQCEAWLDGHGKTTISGLWTVDEYHPYEPSAYIWNAGFTVINTNGDEVFVEGAALWEQVNPKAHGNELFEERMAALAMEESNG